MEHLLSIAGNARLTALAQELEQRGEPFAIATVVNRRPPVSSQLGDKALIRADGTLEGWIGGSCSQPVVRREALAAMAAGQPRLVRLTADGTQAPPATEHVTQVAMTCPSGGEAEIYIEPHLQRPMIVAVGDTPVVRALAQLAPVVGYAVTVVTESGSLGAARPQTFVVVASAGHYDEEALLAALRTEAGYIALVASRRRAAAAMEYLRGAGVSEEALRRVRNPAGLDLGGGTQEEIALSVLAEIVGEHRARLRQGAPEAQVAVAAAPVLAKDPVCGMDVELATARHSHDHDGTAYYFCCPHCRAKFVKDPARYLTPEGGGPAVS